MFLLQALALLSSMACDFFGGSLVGPKCVDQTELNKQTNKQTNPLCSFQSLPRTVVFRDEMNPCLAVAFCLYGKEPAHTRIHPCGSRYSLSVKYPVTSSVPFRNNSIEFQLNSLDLSQNHYVELDIGDYRP